MSGPQAHSKIPLNWEEYLGYYAGKAEQPVSYTGTPDPRFYPSPSFLIRVPSISVAHRACPPRIILVWAASQARFQACSKTGDDDQPKPSILP